MAGAAAVATIFAGAVSYKSSMDASDRADDLADAEQRAARQEAAAIEAETAEGQRRARDKADKVEGESRARAAASGLEVDGSLGISLDSMSAEHARQIAWMGKAGESRARSALVGGDMRSDAAKAQADQLKYQAWGSVASAAGGTYTQGQSAGWWG